MISFDMEQTSDEWFDVRRGVPTSSCFNRIMTSKGMKLAAGATSYMHQLISEAARKGEPADESFSTPAIEHGVKTEGRPIEWLATTASWKSNARSPSLMLAGLTGAVFLTSIWHRYTVT